MSHTRAQEYRRKANQCEESARLLSDPQAKRVLMDIASRWFVMADRVEQDDEKWSRERNVGGSGRFGTAATGSTR